MKFITKLSKNTNLKIAFTTQNTAGKYLSKQKNTYNQNKLVCPDCDKKYIGQTGRPFLIRFQEHVRDYKYGNSKSKFAQHLSDSRHTIGPLENIPAIIHITYKGELLNTVEKITFLKKQELITK